MKINPWRLVPTCLALFTTILILVYFIHYAIGWDNVIQAIVWLGAIVIIFRGLYWMDKHAKEWDKRNGRDDKDEVDRWASGWRGAADTGEEPTINLEINVPDGTDEPGRTGQRAGADVHARNVHP
jgi:hypothetical protein